MRSFSRPVYALTVALSFATLATIATYSSEAKCIVPNKKDSVKSLEMKRKQLHSSRKIVRSKSASSHAVNPDGINNHASINGKHSKSLGHVRKDSVKITTSQALKPGSVSDAQYQAELKNYEMKRKEYEAALIAYEARKKELKSTKVASATASATVQSGSTTQVSPAAPSAPSAVTAVSTTVAPAPEAKKSSGFFARYDGSYEGSSIQTMDSFKPNKDGTASTSVQDLTHLPTLGYTLSPDLALSATAVIIMNTAREANVTWADPYARFKISNLYKGETVNFGTDFRFYPGISAGASKAGRYFRLRNTQYITVTAGAWSLEWTSYLRFSAFNPEDGYKGGDDFKVLVNPIIHYAFTDNLSGDLQWEGATSHEFGEDPGFSDGSGQIKIGVTWSPLAGLYFQPMIGMATGENTRLFDGRSAQLLMDFGYKFF